MITFFVTLFQFEYALRIYENVPLLSDYNFKILGDNKFNDVIINLVTSFFSPSALQMITIMPMFCALCPCIPDNVEAAMTSLITGVFVFSTDVGGRISGGMLCNYFQVDNDNLAKYWVLLLAKCPMIILTMALTFIIPSNKDIAACAERMDAED